MLTNGILSINTGAHLKMDHNVDGTLFGKIPFDRLLDDDDSLGSRESDFETESLASSTSDDDNGGTAADRSAASSPDRRYVHRRRQRALGSDCDDDGSSTDANAEELPNWFISGPFKYNGRVTLLALPGLILALLFAGELLLGLVTVGMLVVYLLYSSGSRQRALVAYLVLFIIIQLTVVYSVLPLIWKSVLNVFIVLALNIYTFLTGGWILLLFENFRFREIDLLMLIETGLFSLYPVAFIIQVTWLVAAMTTVTVAPYVFMLFGFVVLQSFLTPTQSSFVKPHAQGNLAIWDSEGYVLSPVTTAMMAFIYTVAGPALVFVLRIVTGWKTLLATATFVQIAFVASSSVFLASFMHLRLFMESTGVAHKALVSIRWSASLMSLSLVAPLLHCFDVQSTLLPWIPVVVGVYICLVLANLRRSKIGMHSSLGLLAVIALVVFYQLPWQLDYSVAGGSVSLTCVEMLLLLNAAACIAAMYIAMYGTLDELAGCLLVQSTVFIVTSKLLLSSIHISLLLILLSTIVYCYLSLRLYQATRLSRRPCIMLCALHVTSLITSISYVYCATSNGLLVHIYEFVSALVLLAVLFRLLVFEESDVMDNEQLVKCIVGLLCALVANIPVLLTNLLSFLMAASPGVSTHLGFIGLLSSLVYAKLVCFNGCGPINNRFAVFTIVAVPSIVLLALQPDMSLERSDLQKWAMALGVACCVAVVPAASAWKGSLHIVGAVLGLPAGLCILHALFPSSPSLPVQATCGLLAMLCLTLLLIAWYQPKSADQWLRNAGFLVTVCCAALLILSVIDSPTKASDDHFMPPVWPSTAVVTSFSALLLVALVIWLRSNAAPDDECLEPHPTVFSLTPVVGNICAVTSFLLFATNYPPAVSDFWYLWVSVGSSVLFLLTNDVWLMQHLSRSNRIAPPLLAVTAALYGAAVHDCTAFGADRSTLERVVGTCELVSVLASSPVAIILLAVAWSRTAGGFDLVVVFTTPVFLLVFLAGTSYASWILAAAGLGAGFYLMKYRLTYEGYTR